MSLAIPPTNRADDIGPHPCFELSETECDRIVALSENPNSHKIKHWEPEGNIIEFPPKHPDQWLLHEDEVWLDFLILRAAIASNVLFRFQITGLFERPILSHYRAPHDGFDWKVNTGRGDESTRKITVFIPLSNQKDYDGGDICFHEYGEISCKLEKGLCLAYPSYTSNRMKAITKGDCWALTAHIAGEPFK